MKTNNIPTEVNINEVADAQAETPTDAQAETSTDKDIFNENFDSIKDEMLKACYLDTSEEENDFCFEFEIKVTDEIFIMIAADGSIGGEWHSYGDGYYTPKDYVLYQGWGEIENICVRKTNYETDEELPIDKEAIDDLINKLDDALSLYMSSYC